MSIARKPILVWRLFSRSNILVVLPSYPIRNERQIGHRVHDFRHTNTLTDFIKEMKTLIMIIPLSEVLVEI